MENTREIHKDIQKLGTGFKKVKSQINDQFNILNLEKKRAERADEFRDPFADGEDH